MTILEFKQLFKNELSILYTNSESAHLYDIFIEKITGLDPFNQRRHPQQQLQPSEEKQLHDVICELKTGKPYQQILGETEFYGLRFYVDENVLIPRPETEELLELAIEKLKNSGYNSPKIIDIGTGSGVIPIILKKHFPDAHVTSVDFSEFALKTAQKNAELHQVSIQFIHHDYLNFELEEIYDVIISNPPYIGLEEEVEIDDSVKDFEPKIALFSPTSDALIFYRKIAQDAVKNLKKGGWIFLEINQKLGKETLGLYQNDNFENAELFKDISGNDRFTVVRK